MTIFVRTPPVRMLAAAVLALVLLAGHARAEEKIPAKPTRYFNDYALTVRPETADQLNRELEDWERQSSNQLRVVVYPRMQSDSSVDDYCQRVARAWGFGQKEQNNGAVLFVFVENHKIWIATGYGLEGSLNDATSHQIIVEQIAPRFKANDYDGGLTVGVAAMIQATKGEYKGTGQTNYQREHQGDRNSAGGISFGTILFLFIIGYFILSSFRRRGGAMYTGAGPVFWGSALGGGLGGGFGGGDGGGSSSGPSDGGGFSSSGGGDYGGGGAGGDW